MLLANVFKLWAKKNRELVKLTRVKFFPNEEIGDGKEEKMLQNLHWWIVVSHEREKSFWIRETFFQEKNCRGLFFIFFDVSKFVFKI